MFEIGGKRIPATLEELADPRHSALLLWDMENAIAPSAFNYREILANLKTFAALARTAGVPFSIQCKRLSICSKKKPPCGCGCA